MTANQSGATLDGTLLWIGSNRVCGLAEPFEYLLRNAAQLACRLDLGDAIRRAAVDVGTIILARETRSAIDWDDAAVLVSRYPKADRLQLLGPAATGLRQHESHSDWKRIAWHRWESALLSHLPAPSPVTAEPTPCHSVLIIADRFADAEPLIEVAVSSGATAVWSRQPTPGTVQNVDAVWWDDSVGQRASCSQWRERLEAWGSQTRHAWICNHVTPEAYNAALHGGMEVIATKPFAIDRLEAMLPAKPMVQAVRKVA